MTSTEIDPETLLTSHDVGRLLQMNSSSINKWVEDGRISCYRTPGGHRRIRVADLITFLYAHKMPIPPTLAPLGKRRVLIVDDNEKYLAALKRSLKTYAATVDSLMITNGIDALVEVGAFKPHLIVLDVFMPEIDGIEVCRRLKARPETRKIEIIITSGQLTDEIETNAMKAGALRCLRKPFDLPQVLRDLGVTIHSAIAPS